MAYLEFANAPRHATPFEASQYPTLTKGENPFSPLPTAFGYEASFDADNDGEKDDYLCLGSHGRRIRGVDLSPRISCSINLSRSREIEAAWYGEYEFYGRYLSEVRFGDIDRDGDIDIAFRLRDGAIYVFDNLIVNRPAEQRLPQVESSGGGCGHSPGRRP